MLYFGGSILEVWESCDMKHVLAAYFVDTDFNSFCSSLPAPPHLGQADRQAFTTPCAAERAGEVCSKSLLLDFVFKFWAPWKMSATAEGRETRGCPVSVSTMPQQDRLHSKWLTERTLLMEPSKPCQQLWAAHGELRWIPGSKGDVEPKYIEWYR